MSIVTVSANSWEKVPLGCRLFGHVSRGGWWGDLPYADVVRRGHDNIGRKHGELLFECDRCGKRVAFGRIHTNGAVLRAENATHLPDELHSNSEG
jgi:hypothetical protein